MIANSTDMIAVAKFEVKSDNGWGILPGSWRTRLSIQ